MVVNPSEAWVRRGTPEREFYFRGHWKNEEYKKNCLNKTFYQYFLYISNQSASLAHVRDHAFQLRKSKVPFQKNMLVPFSISPFLPKLCLGSSPSFFVRTRKESLEQQSFGKNISYPSTSFSGFITAKGSALQSSFSRLPHNSGSKIEVWSNEGSNNLLDSYRSLLSSFQQDDKRESAQSENGVGGSASLFPYLAEDPLAGVSSLRDRFALPKAGQGLRTVHTPFGLGINSKLKTNNIFGSFFPYRKAFLCYWLCPFVGFMYTLTLLKTDNDLSLNTKNIFYSSGLSQPLEHGLEHAQKKYNWFSPFYIRKTPYLREGSSSETWGREGRKKWDLKEVAKSPSVSQNLKEDYLYNVSSYNKHFALSTFEESPMEESKNRLIPSKIKKELNSLEGGGTNKVLKQYCFFYFKSLENYLKTAASSPALPSALPFHYSKARDIIGNGCVQPLPSQSAGINNGVAKVPIMSPKYSTSLQKLQFNLDEGSSSKLPYVTFSARPPGNQYKWFWYKIPVGFSAHLHTFQSYNMLEGRFKKETMEGLVEPYTSEKGLVSNLNKYTYIYCKRQGCHYPIFRAMWGECDHSLLDSNGHAFGAIKKDPYFTPSSFILKLSLFGDDNIFCSQSMKISPSHKFAPVSSIFTNSYSIRNPLSSFKKASALLENSYINLISFADFCLKNISRPCRSQEALATEARFLSQQLLDASVKIKPQHLYFSINPSKAWVTGVLTKPLPPPLRNYSSHAKKEEKGVLQKKKEATSSTPMLCMDVAPTPIENDGSTANTISNIYIKLSKDNLYKLLLNTFKISLKDNLLLKNEYSIQNKADDKLQSRAKLQLSGLHPEPKRSLGKKGEAWEVFARTDHKQINHNFNSSLILETYNELRIPIFPEKNFILSAVSLNKSLNKASLRAEQGIKNKNSFSLLSKNAYFGPIPFEGYKSVRTLWALPDEGHIFCAKKEEWAAQSEKSFLNLKPSLESKTRTGDQRILKYSHPIFMSLPLRGITKYSNFKYLASSDTCPAFGRATQQVMKSYVLPLYPSGRSLTEGFKPLNFSVIEKTPVYSREQGVSSVSFPFSSRIVQTTPYSQSPPSNPSEALRRVRVRQMGSSFACDSPSAGKDQKEGLERQNLGMERKGNKQSLLHLSKNLSYNEYSQYSKFVNLYRDKLKNFMLFYKASSSAWGKKRGHIFSPICWHSFGAPREYTPPYPCHPSRFAMGGKVLEKTKPKTSSLIKEELVNIGLPSIFARRVSVNGSININNVSYVREEQINEKLLRAFLNTKASSLLGFKHINFKRAASREPKISYQILQKTQSLYSKFKTKIQYLTMARSPLVYEKAYQYPLPPLGQDTGSPGVMPISEVRYPKQSFGTNKAKLIKINPKISSPFSTYSISVLRNIQTFSVSLRSGKRLDAKAGVKKDFNNLPKNSPLLLVKNRSFILDKNFLYISERKPSIEISTTAQDAASSGMLLLNKEFERGLFSRGVEALALPKAGQSSPEGTTPLNTTSAGSAESVVSPSFYLRKHEQKKRRIKKLKKETRVRKKRKRFYPRPLWIRYRLYTNFLKKRTNPLYKYGKARFIPFTSRTPINSSVLCCPAFGRAAQHAKKERKKDKTFLSLNANKGFYTISRAVLGDLKRVLWKSYWLRSNLNPYLTKVKTILSQMKKSTQLLVPFYKTLRSLILYLGGFKAGSFEENLQKYKYIYLPVPSLSLMVGQNYLDTTFNKSETYNLRTDNTKLQKYYLNFEALSSISKWQNALYLAEYDRITYGRLQQYIAQIRENGTSQYNYNSQNKIRLYHIGHSNTQTLSSFGRKKKKDLNKQNEKDLWVKIGKTIMATTEGYSQVSNIGALRAALSSSREGDIITPRIQPIVPQLRMYWALSKTNYGSFMEKEMYKRKQTWTVGKARETKYNKTKKIYYIFSRKLESFLNEQMDNNHLSYPFINLQEGIFANPAKGRVSNPAQREDLSNIWKDLERKAITNNKSLYYSLNKTNLKEEKALYFGFKRKYSENLRLLKKNLQQYNYSSIYPKKTFQSLTVPKTQSEGSYTTYGGVAEGRGNKKQAIEKTIMNIPYFSTKFTNKSAYWWDINHFWEGCQRVPFILQPYAWSFHPNPLSPLSPLLADGQKGGKYKEGSTTIISSLYSTQNQNFLHFFQTLWISSLLFHFCAILSLISLSQIRSLFKVYMIFIGKIYKTSVWFLGLSYDSINNIKNYSYVLSEGRMSCLKFSSLSSKPPYSSIGHMPSHTRLRPSLRALPTSPPYPPSTPPSNPNPAFGGVTEVGKGRFANPAFGRLKGKGLGTCAIKPLQISERAQIKGYSSYDGQNNPFISNSHLLKNSENIRVVPFLYLSSLQGKPQPQTFGKQILPNLHSSFPWGGFGRTGLLSLLFSRLPLTPSGLGVSANIEGNKKNIKTQQYFYNLPSLTEGKTRPAFINQPKFYTYMYERNLSASLISSKICLEEISEALENDGKGNLTKGVAVLDRALPYGMTYIVHKTSILRAYAFLFLRYLIQKPIYLYKKTLKSKNIDTFPTRLKVREGKGKQEYTKMGALKMYTSLYSLLCLNSVSNIIYNFYFGTSSILKQTVETVGILAPRSIFSFFEKPGELILDWIAYMFLVEWASDITNTIPENVDVYIGNYFYKLLLSKTSFWNTLQNLNNITLLSLLGPTLGKLLLALPEGYGHNLALDLQARATPYMFTNMVTNKYGKYNIIETYNFSNIWDKLFLNVGSTFIQRRIYHLYEILLFQLYQPDTDLINRQKKGVIFWDIWGDFLMQVAEDSNINISELTSVKEEQIKLLENCTDSFATINESLKGKQIGGSKGLGASLTTGKSWDKNVEDKNVENKNVDEKKSLYLRTRAFMVGINLSSLRKGKFSQPDSQNKYNWDAFVTLPREAQAGAASSTCQHSWHVAPSGLGVKKMTVGGDGRAKLWGSKGEYSEYSSYLQDKSVFAQKLYNSSKRKKGGTGSQQFLSYQGKDTELFIDLHPPKNFFMNLLNFNESVQQPVGSLVCQIFSGLLSKQISKNILVVSPQGGDGGNSSFSSLWSNQGFQTQQNCSSFAGMEKTLLVQAIAGETELKMITDNAYRYAMVYRGVAVGIKLLRDVFDSLSLHTPCLFLIEDIHAIGERRPLLISDGPSFGEGENMSSFGSQREEIHEKNQILYQLSKHIITHYRKPYKGDFSLLIPTNHFCFDLFRGAKDYSSSIGEGVTGNTKLAGLSSDKTLSPRIFIHTSPDGQGNVNSEGQERGSSLIATHMLKHFSSTRLLMKSSELLAPPAYSPFSVLTLKQEKKFKPYKVVKNVMPWSGLPGEMLAQVSKASYSIRVKVALLADMAISSLSVKLDMITDLLVIIDSVKGNRGFVVFATTHVPYILDPALRRPGRLDETITLASFNSSTILSRWEILKSTIISNVYISGLTYSKSFNLNSSLGFSRGFNEQTGFYKGITLDYASSLLTFTSFSSINSIQQFNKNLKIFISKNNNLAYSVRNTTPFVRNVSHKFLPSFFCLNNLFVSKRYASFAPGLRDEGATGTSAHVLNTQAGPFFGDKTRSDGSSKASLWKSQANFADKIRQKLSAILKDDLFAAILLNPKKMISRSLLKPAGLLPSLANPAFGRVRSEAEETKRNEINDHIVRENHTALLYSKYMPLSVKRKILAQTYFMASLMVYKNSHFSMQKNNKKKTRLSELLNAAKLPLVLQNNPAKWQSFSLLLAEPKLCLVAEGNGQSPEIYDGATGGSEKALTCQHIGSTCQLGWHVAQAKFGLQRQPTPHIFVARHGLPYISDKKAGCTENQLFDLPFGYPSGTTTETSFYLSFYSSPSTNYPLKNQMIQFIAGKLGEMLYFSKTSWIPFSPSIGFSRAPEPYVTCGPEIYDRAKARGKASQEQQADGAARVKPRFQLSHSGAYTSYGLNTWQMLSSLVVSFVHKRFIYHQNFIVPNSLFFNNINPLMEPPSPPASNILLPARRYENYKRSFSFFSLPSPEGREAQNSKFIMEKIQLHQQQRLVKRLYRYPVKESFRSEIIENRFTGFSNAALNIGRLNDILQKPSRTLCFIKNRILMRHKDYFTNQWWTGQLPEHNAETTFLSDIDWRYTFVESVGDLLLDFPDADQYYNPRNRRWLLTKGSFHNWFDFDKNLYSEIYSHFIFDSFVKAYQIYEINREGLDYYAFHVLQNGLHSTIHELDYLKLYKRFFKS